MGVTQSAGLSFRWLKETFFAGLELRRFDRRG
jgi:hypothetical protein